MPLSFALATALYAAAATFAAGIAWRVWVWARTPEPFRIPTTTRAAAIAGLDRAESRREPVDAARGRRAAGPRRRCCSDRCSGTPCPGRPRAARTLCPPPVFFERKALWLGAMALHWSLLVIVLRHLRLFVDPVPGRRRGPGCPRRLLRGRHAAVVRHRRHRRRRARVPAGPAAARPAAALRDAAGGLPGPGGPDDRDGNGHRPAVRRARRSRGRPDLHAGPGGAGARCR